MSFSKINTSFSSNITQNKLRDTSGIIEALDSNRDASNDFSPKKLDDSDLLFLASQGPKQRMIGVAKNSLKAIFIAVPLVDSVLSGLTQKGSLSQKTFKSVKTLGRWAGVIALAGSFFAVKKAVNKKSETLRTLDKENKFLSTGVDLGLLYLILKAGAKSFRGLQQKFVKNFPNINSGFNNRISKPVKDLLDKSLINKNAVVPAEKFCAKNFYWAKAAKAISVLAAPTILVGTYARLFNEVKKQQENVVFNYSVLKQLNK